MNANRLVVNIRIVRNEPHSVDGDILQAARLHDGTYQVLSPSWKHNPPLKRDQFVIVEA